jgi:hypothetical protein
MITAHAVQSYLLLGSCQTADGDRQIARVLASDAYDKSFKFDSLP